MVEIFVFEDGSRHIPNPSDGEFTLCGWAWDVGVTDEHAMGSSHVTTGTTNCPECIAHVEALKAIQGKWKEDSD